ncbi:hypothetical protein [Streptomyces sp. NPDC097619]|uniref:hypothetical protein n=1 Tax=Streptomyces sp. NPDC097619 TaxID=3157228 RepID=UPI00331FA0C8
MSGDLLRRALAAFEEAAPGEGLARIAGRLGVGPADLAAYWVRKGRLVRREIGPPDCSGCFFAGRSCTGCPTAGGARGPVLVSFTPARPGPPSSAPGARPDCGPPEPGLR